MPPELELCPSDGLKALLKRHLAADSRDDNSNRQIPRLSFDVLCCDLTAGGESGRSIRVEGWRDFQVCRERGHIEVNNTCILGLHPASILRQTSGTPSKATSISTNSHPVHLSEAGLQPIPIPSMTLRSLSSQVCASPSRSTTTPVPRSLTPELSNFHPLTLDANLLRSR
jgi:hypothetical protein